MRTVAILSFLACCLACAGGRVPTGNDQDKPPFQNNQEIVRVTLAELHDDGRQNPKQTAEKYKDKSVLISGTVLAFHPNMALPTVSVWDGKKGVLCKFYEQERARVLAYNADSQITLTGNVFVAANGEHVELRNCAIHR